MTDEADYAAMAELIDRIAADSERLRELAEGDVPAVEKNAERIEDAAAILRMNVPPELAGDERQD